MFTGSIIVIAIGESVSVGLCVQVERLLRAIYMPQNVYCIHIDSKSPDNVQHSAAAIANCFDNVFIASRQESVRGHIHRRRNREGGTSPTFSLQGPCCFSPLPQLEPKIKQLQHIHKPHVTFYMRKLYLMAAPSLMFHFLDSLQRSLLLEARFSA